MVYDRDDSGNDDGGNDDWMIMVDDGGICMLMVKVLSDNFSVMFR